jgi:hypothetical protein
MNERLCDGPVEAYLIKNKQLVVNLHKDKSKKKDAPSRILFGIKLIERAITCSRS